MIVNLKTYLSYLSWLFWFINDTLRNVTSTVALLAHDMMAWRLLSLQLCTFLHWFRECVQHATFESHCRCHQLSQVAEIIYFWQGWGNQMKASALLEALFQMKLDKFGANPRILVSPALWSKAGKPGRSPPRIIKWSSVDQVIVQVISRKWASLDLKQ